MKAEHLISIFAIFFFTWELFFSATVDFIEIAFILMEFEYNEFWFLLIRLGLIVLFLLTFLWLRGRSKREKQFAQRRIP